MQVACDVSGGGCEFSAHGESHNLTGGARLVGSMEQIRVEHSKSVAQATPLAPHQVLKEQRWCRRYVSICLVERPARLPALLDEQRLRQQASMSGPQCCAAQNGLRCMHCAGGLRSCCTAGHLRQALCWRPAVCSVHSLTCALHCVVHRSCLLCQVADPVAPALTMGGLRSCCSSARSQRDLLQVLCYAVKVNIFLSWYGMPGGAHAAHHFV